MKKHIAEYYSAEELKTLLEGVKGTPLETVVYLASRFGLRRGEIIGLRWSGIDLERGILSVTGTVKDKGASGSKRKNLRYEPTAKTASSLRSFPLSDSVIAYLRKIKKRQDENRAADQHYHHEWDAFVCVRDNRDLLPLEYVSRVFPTLCENCGLKRLKPHELRHTNISLLPEAGASMKELQEWAGHSSCNTTANVYSHLQANSKNRLTDTMGKILSWDLVRKPVRKTPEKDAQNNGAVQQVKGSNTKKHRTVGISTGSVLLAVTYGKEPLCF